MSDPLGYTSLALTFPLPKKPSRTVVPYVNRSPLCVRRADARQSLMRAKVNKMILLMFYNER